MLVRRVGAHRLFAPRDAGALQGCEPRTRGVEVPCLIGVGEQSRLRRQRIERGIEVAAIDGIVESKLDLEARVTGVGVFADGRIDVVGSDAARIDFDARRASCELPQRRADPLTVQIPDRLIDARADLRERAEVACLQDEAREVAVEQVPGMPRRLQRPSDQQRRDMAAHELRLVLRAALGEICPHLAVSDSTTRVANPNEHAHPRRHRAERTTNGNVDRCLDDRDLDRRQFHLGPRDTLEFDERRAGVGRLVAHGLRRQSLRHRGPSPTTRTPRGRRCRRGR